MAPPKKIKPKRARATPPAQRDAPAGSVTMARKIMAANRWRAQYNPLRGLTLTRAVALLEQAPRGIFADLQWTYFFVEQTDADLIALIERRTSPLLEMDWDAKIVPNPADRPRQNFDEKLAEDQRAALQEAYDRIENLYDCFEHLALATFRGFSHAEKARTVSGDTVRFEIVDQWNIVRDGLNGDWKYNPEAQQTSFDALPGDLLIDPVNFIIREVKRPVDRIALIKFIRGNLSEKDWDAFVEIYGVPGGVITGPPNVPQGKEAEYEAAAREVAEGGSGYLPHGSEYKPNTVERGQNPFRDRLDYLTEKVILAGTGGLLTMLTQSGSGTLAGGAHSETFAKIAKSDARKISEVFQRQFDKPILAEAFPEKPILSYFELALNEETDPGQVVDDAEKLSRAGYGMDLEELSEKSGYNIHDRPQERIDIRPQASPATADAITKQAEQEISNSVRHLFNSDRAVRRFLRSREGRELIANKVQSKSAQKKMIRTAAEQYGEARRQDLKPVADAIQTALKLGDAGSMQRLRQGLAPILKIVNRNPSAAPVIAGTLSAGLFNGLELAAKERKQNAP